MSKGSVGSNHLYDRPDDGVLPGAHQDDTGCAGSDQPDSDNPIILKNVCSKCRFLLPLKAFYPGEGYKYDRRGICKLCMSKTARAYYEAHKEKMREYQRRRRATLGRYGTIKEKGFQCAR